MVTGEIHENRGISPYRTLKETFGLRTGLNPLTDARCEGPLNDMELR